MKGGLKERGMERTSDREKEGLRERGIERKRN